MDEPVNKKVKLYEEQNKYKIIVDYISSIRTSSKNLQAILSDELTEAVPMIDVYAGRVRDLKDISKTIHILNEKLPLNDLGHLKRVRNGIILLCESTATNALTIQEFINTHVPELCDVFEYFKDIPVPKWPPKLKYQHLELNKKWSCNFHPDSYLEKLASDKFFSKSEVRNHRLYMAIAFEVALWHFKSQNVTVTEEMLFDMNVCVVVDPEINSVVAIAIDNHMKHPIQHCAMLAIDNVAKTQDGGAWNNDLREANPENCFNGIEVDILKYLKTQFSNVNFGAKKFQSKSDLLQQEKSTEDGPYLCTNYYIYMLREPCVMCAMALVHARARRLFFCFDNFQNGAVKSKTKLHTLTSLNHRYEVFSGFL